jgi:hypothetical protein
MTDEAGSIKWGVVIQTVIAGAVVLLVTRFLALSEEVASLNIRAAQAGARIERMEDHLASEIRASAVEDGELKGRLTGIENDLRRLEGRGK